MSYVLQKVLLFGTHNLWVIHWFIFIQLHFCIHPSSVPTTCGSYIGLFSSSCTFVSILVRFLMLCKRTYLSFGGPYRCNPIPLFIFRHTCTACSISQVYPNDIIIVIPSIYRMYIYIYVCVWWLIDDYQQSNLGLQSTAP